MENLEKKQKQTIERLEQDHTSRLRDEAKRIKADQDKELSKFQNMLKNRKKEVSPCMSGCGCMLTIAELGVICMSYTSSVGLTTWTVASTSVSGGGFLFFAWLCLYANPVANARLFSLLRF